MFLNAVGVVEAGGSLCLVLILAPQSQRLTTICTLSPSPLLPPPPVTPILLCIPDSSPQTLSEMTDPTPSKNCPPSASSRGSRLATHRRRSATTSKGADRLLGGEIFMRLLDLQSVAVNFGRWQGHHLPNQPVSTHWACTSGFVTLKKVACPIRYFLLVS